MTGPRVPAVAVGALWPAGVLLALAHQEVAAVTTPVFLALDACYLAVALAVLVRLRAHRRGALGVLAAAPVVLFAVAGYTGEPSGAEPSELLLNTAVLLVVAVSLLLAVAALVLRHRGSAVALPAAVALVALLVASAGYLVNLLGRVAVVLTGLAERQASLEDRSWVASEYLRGLPTEADPLAYLLTWMDLVQLGYVVAAYAGTAGLARLLRAEGVVSRGTGRLVERAGWAGAVLLTGAIALAVGLPRDLDAVPAGAAFALSIPFMTTLLPFVLAGSALRRSA